MGGGKDGKTLTRWEGLQTTQHCTSASQRILAHTHVRQPQPLPSTSQPPNQIPVTSGLTRARTPTSDNENDYRHDARPSGGKGGGSKGNNPSWDSGKERGGQKVNMETVESSFSQVLSREIQKTEENLHSRLEYLINKEMDKQSEDRL